MKTLDMNIEKVIKQKRSFRNPWHKAAVNLIYTTNWLTDQIKRLLKPYGITMQQYNVLRILRGAGEPISTSVIRDRMLDKMSDTSRMVDRLHQKGLVHRRACPTDKRLVDVSLSEKGETLLQQLDQINEDLDRIPDKLTAEEAQTLSQLLDKMRN